MDMVYIGMHRLSDFYLFILLNAKVIYLHSHKANILVENYLLIIVLFQTPINFAPQSTFLLYPYEQTNRYAHSIFKNKMQTGVLSCMLCLLYIFLYVVLQLEDVALLIGSIGLFIMLGIIMFFSRKINWYKQEEEEGEQISF